jgi:hypothetical protein
LNSEADNLKLKNKIGESHSIHGGDKKGTSDRKHERKRSLRDLDMYPRTVLKSI